MLHPAGLRVPVLEHGTRKAADTRVGLENVARDRKQLLTDLVEVFASKEGLIAGVGPQQGGEGVSLLGLLPGRAAAVSLQRVVDDVVVVRIFPRQDAGATGAAQRTGNKLGRQQVCFHLQDPSVRVKIGKW